MTSRSPIWHPFTQHALQPDATMIARGEGAWLETPDGKRILDAISSWWVVTHGHRHPKIIAAIKEQADKLDQVIFAGFTHEPAERLGQKLIAAVNAHHPTLSPWRLQRSLRGGGLVARLLLRLRFHGRRSRAQDGARLLAQHWRTAHAHHCAGARLSRRHHRHDVGRRARRVQCSL